MRTDEQGRSYVVTDSTVPLVTTMPDNVVTVNVSASNQSFVIPVVLFAATSGNISVTSVGGQSLLIESWPAGMPLPFRVTTVFSSLTTAAKMIGVW